MYSMGQTGTEEVLHSLEENKTFRNGDTCSFYPLQEQSKALLKVYTVKDVHV